MKDVLKNFTIRRHWWLKLIWDKKYTFLYETGWIRSFKERRPVNLNGETLPWLSQSIIYFLEDRLKTDFRVFEYGCGNSTLWFSRKGIPVHSVELDASWYEIIKDQLPSSCKLILQQDLEKYPLAIGSSSYELVLIDGRNRVKCMEAAIRQLSETGVIILDDSNRDKYYSCYEIAQANGFRWIDFWGVGPGSIEWKSTTVFYRDNNCLGV